MKRILTQGTGGMEGYHGTMGTVTNMSDSYGTRLFVGDLVSAIHLSSTKDDYSIEYVCEENTSVVNQQYIMGLASLWNSDNYAQWNINYNYDYWDKLIEITDGWVVHKVKHYADVVENELWGFLYAQTINDFFLVKHGDESLIINDLREALDKYNEF